MALLVECWRQSPAHYHRYLTSTERQRPAAQSHQDHGECSVQCWHLATDNELVQQAQLPYVIDALALTFTSLDFNL